MAIGHRATGTAVFGQNSITPAIPAAQVTGDMMLLLAAGKPFGWDDGTNPVAQGWTSLGTITDGSVAASAADLGSMKIECWYKEAASDTETDPTITETGTWDVVGGIVMVFSKGGADSWNTPVMVGGGDATAGTGFSVTAGSNPGITAGDHCVSMGAFRSDAATPCSSHITPTATSATFTNTHDPATDPESTTGFDMGMCITRSTLTGTASAAPVLAATLAAAHTGSAAIIRLRVTAGTAYTATPSDSVTLADALAKGQGKLQADTLSLADSLSRVSTSARTPADTVALADARAFAQGKALADTVTLSDLVTPVKFAAHTSSPADTVALADALTINWVQDRAGDTVALSDSLSRAVAAVRTLTDSVTLADARAHARGKALTDSITLADLLTPQTGKGVSLSDSVVLSDSLSRVMGYGRTVADGIILTDATRDAQGIRLGDTLALTDSLARVAAITRSVQDSLALADQLARTATVVRTVADTVALADQATAQKSGAGAQAVNDLLTVADSFSRTATYARSLADTVALADLVTVLTGKAAQIADSIILSDLFARSTTVARLFADVVTLTDAIAVDAAGPFQQHFGSFGSSPRSRVGSTPRVGALAGSPQSVVESNPMEERFDD